MDAHGSPDAFSVIPKEDCPHIVIFQGDLDSAFDSGALVMGRPAARMPRACRLCFHRTDAPLLRARCAALSYRSGQALRQLRRQQRDLDVRDVRVGGLQPVRV